jgi:uncharacterized protein YbjT (DUF2867 family)
VRVAITGANSATGRALMRHAATAGESLGIVAVVRSERAAEEVRPLLGAGGRVARVAYDDRESLDAALRGAS